MPEQTQQRVLMLPIDDADTILEFLTRFPHREVDPMVQALKRCGVGYTVRVAPAPDKGVSPPANTMENEPAPKEGTSE